MGAKRPFKQQQEGGHTFQKKLELVEPSKSELYPNFKTQQ